MKKYLFPVSLFLTIGILVFVSIACLKLSPEQRVAYTELKQQKANIDYLIQLIDERIISINAMILDGKITMEAAQKEIDVLVTEKQKALNAVSGIIKSIVKMDEVGMPWYGYVLAALPTVLALGKSFVNGKDAKLGFEMASTLSRGITNYLDNPKGKLITKHIGEAAGAENNKLRARLEVLRTDAKA